MLQSFSMEQKTALSILKTGRNVYLTGAAGSGKTHVLNQYIDFLKKHHVGVGITASTGIAATHIGGMTIHSWAGIGIKDYLSEWDLDALSQRQPLVKRFQRTDVLVIEEVSMLKPEILDMVDEVARTLKRVDSPFGGMQVVLSGDFFQLPPVVRGSREAVFADSATAWRTADLRTCYLTEQHRQKEGGLSDVLNDIRDGEISKNTKKLLEERLSINSESDSAVVLHTHNENVDTHNKRELDKVSGDSAEYEMVSAGRAHLIESLKKSVLAPELLELKVGARVMFVKNAPDQEYVNGTLGTVSDISGEYPLITTTDGRTVHALPVSWEIVDDNKVLASVSQVPLRLAWAITVHKSQGMTLDAVEVDLSRAFTPGQGYVALSRARALEGLSLRGINAQALEVHPYVRDLDEILRADSEKWEQVFKKFSADKVKDMQEEFLLTIQRDEPAQKTTRPTHLITRDLLAKELSLKAIAKERGLTLGTILGHLEKLRDAGDYDIFSYLEPETKRFSSIVKACDGDAHIKLALLQENLRGEYTFEELRFARLFVTGT